jgi:DNA-binding IclR family transcriptional regulator
MSAPQKVRQARGKTKTAVPNGRGRPRTRGKRDDDRHVQAVLHAVDVLQAMAVNDREMGVSELARRSGLSKAATYAILRTLESRRLVARDPGVATYRLGWALYEMGANVVRNLDLSRVARTHLDELAGRTGDAVLLGILEDGAVLHVDRGESPDQFHMVANIGRRSPIHASASGKAILAFADLEVVQAVLARPLKPFTIHTRTDIVALQAELAGIRRQGYATCWQEVEIGLSSISVPLRDYSGDVVAALTLAGPVARVNEEAAPALVAELRATADVIEQRLGASVAES